VAAISKSTSAESERNVGSKWHIRTDKDDVR